MRPCIWKDPIDFNRLESAEFFNTTTQSAEGSRFVESMMTVVATLKQQQRNVLEYLTTACEAALRGEAAPSLLPASEQKSQAAA